MFKNILNNNQKDLLFLVREFYLGFYLAGGTAIALQIGHRRSIDFDLFTDKPLNTKKIINIIKQKKCGIDATLEESREELTLIINGVKVTFLEYPFDIEPSVDFDKNIIMPDILTLSSMKAYSLGRRSKWKDYIDLFFILKDFFTIKEISQKAKGIFGGAFNERLFREQLTYYEDLDFTEGIEYVGEKIDDKIIKEIGRASCRERV